MANVVIVHLTKSNNERVNSCDGQPYSMPKENPGDKMTLCDECWKISLGIHDVVETTYTSETMDKVHTALGQAGLTDLRILDAVTCMQNAGILFRERA